MKIHHILQKVEKVQSVQPYIQTLTKIHTHSVAHVPSTAQCIHISGCHCVRPLKQVIHWQWIKWDVIIFKQSLVEQRLNGQRNMCCSRAPLLPCRRVCFTVARQRLTVCNQIVCQRVSHCVCVCVSDWLGGWWVAVEWLDGGAEGVVVMVDGRKGIWGRWKISLWLSSEEMAWDIYCSVPATYPPLAVFPSQSCYVSCSFDLFLFLSLLSSLS